MEKNWKQIALVLKSKLGNSLVVQWLGHGAFTARGLGLIPLVRELRSHNSWSAAKEN